MCSYFSVYTQCNVSNIRSNITYKSAISANRESFCRHRQYPLIYLLNKKICSIDSDVVLFRVELLMWYLNLNSNRLSMYVVLFWTTHSSIMWGHILGVHYPIHRQKICMFVFLCIRKWAVILAIELRESKKKIWLKLLCIHLFVSACDFVVVSRSRIFCRYMGMCPSKHSLYKYLLCIAWKSGITCWFLCTGYERDNIPVSKP